MHRERRRAASFLPFTRFAPLSVIFIVGPSLSVGSLLFAAEPPAAPAASKDQHAPAAVQSPEETEHERWWLKPIPVPADLELEQQLTEIQQALQALHEQIVRRKQALNNTQEPTVKTTLYHEIELLRAERDKLEALLHDLVNEAKASEKTAIDEAIARARGLERQQEYWQRKEEATRDRRQ